jgi:putative CocE/NonD family hydrolase
MKKFWQQVDRFKSSTRWRVFAVLSSLLLFGCAEDKSAVKASVWLDENYAKQEYRVPMRDGVELLTAVYTPRNTARGGQKAHPIILTRTPYTLDGFVDHFVPELDGFFEAGYILAIQELRGTGRSQGGFVLQRPHQPRAHDSGPPEHAHPSVVDASTDSYDTVEWLLAHIEHHNERVGLWGVSYMGWTTLMGMINPHPAVKAFVPEASLVDGFVGDDWYHNGAFSLTRSYSWSGFMSLHALDPTQAGQSALPLYRGQRGEYDFFLKAGPSAEFNQRFFQGHNKLLQDFVEHWRYDDYWQGQNPLKYLNNIDLPVLNVAGWFDAEDFYGPINAYGGWWFSDGELLGDIHFGSKTGAYYREKLILPFFEYHLKGKPGWQPSEALVFETGRNQWQYFDQWPPKTVQHRSLFFHKKGRLSFHTPIAESSAEAPSEPLDNADHYLSDPGKPIPYTQKLAAPDSSWVVEDQRLAATRADVLVYETEVLEEALTLAGPIQVNLFVSSTGSDADFVVKLIDVWDKHPNEPKNKQLASPGGYQQLIGSEIMRAKFRESLSDPKPLEPNKITPIRFTLWDRFHTFKKGHRLMVQVQSSLFPLYDRNPQVFMNIHQAKAEDYQSARQTIYRSSKYPSHLVLPLYGDNK